MDTNLQVTVTKSRAMNLKDRESTSSRSHQGSVSSELRSVRSTAELSSSSSVPSNQTQVRGSAGREDHFRKVTSTSVAKGTAERKRSQQHVSQRTDHVNISPHRPIKSAKSSGSQPVMEKSDLRQANGDFARYHDNESETRRDGKLAVPEEPDVAAEAPEPPVDNSTNAEEAVDDVEFPEAVVLVGKTHWRCVSCMIFHPRTASIDDHMNVHHSQQAVPEVTPPVPKRGRGRGRALRGTIPNPPGKPVSEIEQMPLRSTLRPAQVAEHPRAIRGKRAAVYGKPKLQRGRGRRIRGNRGGRGGRTRGGRGRGRGRIFTKPLTSDDSDTEIDLKAPSPPPKLSSRKRRTRASLEADAIDKPLDDVTSPPSKKARDGVNKLPPAEKDIESPPPLPSPEPVSQKMLEPISQEMAEPLSQEMPESMSQEMIEPMSQEMIEPMPQEMLKDLMKEKYVVIVEKAKGLDYPSETEGHMNNDPPLPIEIPSLQADALLPPATPLLPDIHGPPETPLLPDTPHPPETPHQPDTFLPPETVPMDVQELSQPHGFLSPGMTGILSTMVSDPVAKTQERSGAEDHAAALGSFSSAGGQALSKAVDSESTLPAVCRTCGAEFDSPEELRSHREEMVKFDVVSCNSCGDKFHGLHQLNIHVFTVHEKYAKKFCFLCDADCLDGFELEEHLLEHTSIETDREDDADDLDSIQHVCKTCGAQLEGNFSDLLNHYHTVHNQFICTRCYEIFTDLAEYEDHKMLHASDVEDISAPVVYTCPVSDCFQMCSDKEALMDHISWHEDRDLDEEQLNLLHCHHCSEPFRNKVSLQRHLAETHIEPDLRPFVCELCSEAFSHSLELHRHNTLHHAGIKRYGCAYCNQRFAFRSSHRRHVASEHDVAATVLRM